MLVNISSPGPPDPVSNLSSSVSQESVVTLTWTPPNPGPFKISYKVYYRWEANWPVQPSLTRLSPPISKADNISKITTIVVTWTSPSVQLSGLQEGSYLAYMVTVGQNSSTIVQSSPSDAVGFSIEPREPISCALNSSYWCLPNNARQLGVSNNASPVIGAVSGSVVSVLFLITLVSLVALGLVWFVRWAVNVGCMLDTICV